MSIEQVSLNKDSGELNKFLKALIPDFLTEVSEPDESGEFTCKDLKGNEVLKWVMLTPSQKIGFRIVTGEETVDLFTATRDTNMKPNFGVRTKHGAVIRISDSSGRDICHFLITKNTLGNTCFVFSDVQTSYGLHRNLLNFRCSTYQDRSPVIAAMNLSQVQTESQTVLVPFVSTGPKDVNTPCATEHAFFMPYCQISEECTLIVNGVKYWTNGVWALEDE